jgi:hypothetical protein
LADTELTESERNAAVGSSPASGVDDVPLDLP